MVDYAVDFRCFKSEETLLKKVVTISKQICEKNPEIFF